MTDRAIDGVNNWPVFWRVVAPSCGSYGHDIVFIETDSEREAIRKHRALRRAGTPVRLERIHCGPLPKDSEPALQAIHAGNAQHPGEPMRAASGAWCEVERS
ncbi:MAG: hypothetical protein U1F35_05510 [Steroidobacteraceae bacterium]